MPSSTYTALNGREIKEMVRNRINAEIDKLPYLREGNSFHKAQVEFGFVMSCYPADVPVPEKELEFEINAKSLDEFEEALNQVESAEKLAEQITKLEEHVEMAQNLLNQALEARGTIVFETEVSEKIDGTIPDAARLAANMSVPIIQTKGGKQVETTISAVQFKKVAKL